MLYHLSQLIYPWWCRSCGEIIAGDSIFCCRCKSSIKLVVPLFLPLTHHKSLGIYAASAYQPPLKNLIVKKFSYDILACNQLADLMYELIPFDTIKPDFFVAVPLHWSRFSWRGYNQAYKMAERLGRRLNIPVLDALKRNKRTIFQSKLSGTERQKNVANAFILKDHNLNEIRGKNLAIVDDLFTSGATIKSAAKALLPLNPNSITAVVGCRVI